MKSRSLDGMSRRRAWLTPDSVPDSAARCCAVFYPPGEDYEAAVRGALALLGDSANWEQFGAQTPDETAQQFLVANLKTFTNWGAICMPVGTVFMFAGATAPERCLVCDGSQVDQDDFAELYALIGNTYGSADSGYFRLPDLRSRSAIGTGQGSGLSSYSLGDTGGEESHQLTTGEMPSHTHTVHGHIDAVAVTPGELPVSTPSFSSVTGSAGSDGSHENRPPFLALLPCIVAV